MPRVKNLITLTLSSWYECVDDNLRAVEEISELRFPDDQVIWVLNTHAIFKTETSFFWQRTVDHLCGRPRKRFFSEIYITSTKVSRQVSDRKSAGLEEFVMEILRRIVLNTSRNPFCCSDMLFSGTNISSVCWSTSIVCLWLNVPLPTSCPLKRTWYPVKRKVRTKLIA